MNRKLHYELVDDEIKLIVNPLGNYKGKRLADKMIKPFRKFLIEHKSKPINNAGKIPNWVSRLDHSMTDIEEPDPSYVDTWIPTEAVININVLKDKVGYNYYFTIEDFLADIKQMIKNAFVRCANDHAKFYVSDLYTFILTMCADAKRIFQARIVIEFYELYKSMIATESLRVPGVWDKKPMTRRQYFLIDEYVSGIKGDDSVFDRMKTKLRGNCDGTHCLKFEDLGPLSLAEDTWITQ